MKRTQYQLNQENHFPKPPENTLGTPGCYVILSIRYGCGIWDI